MFSRRPLFAYRVAAAGMIGVALLSFFVWQHHLFQSGINPDMRPLFMLTTELISIPTGFIYLVGLGTLWKAKIRFGVPMLFCLALYFNFLIGGVTGRVPVGRAGERDGARQRSSCWPTSTTRSWAAWCSPSSRPLLLDPQDHREDAQQEAGPMALLDDVHLLQPDVLPDVPDRALRPAPPGVRVRRKGCRG